MTELPQEYQGNFPTLRVIPGGVWRASRWLVRMTWKPALVLLVLLMVAHIMLNLFAGRRLEAELARARAAGEPLKFTELAPSPLPDSENAAILYLQAFRHFPDTLAEGEDEEGLVIRRFVSELSRRGESHPSLAEVEPLLAKHAADLRLIRAASLMPACRFPVKWENPLGTFYPHLAKVYQATFYLTANAIAAAHHGQSAAALEDLATVIRIGNHLSSEPTLTAQSVRQRSLGFVFRALPEVFAAVPPSEEQLRQFLALLDAVDMKGPYLRGLQGERCQGLLFFDLLRERGPATAAELVNRPDLPQTFTTPGRAFYALVGLFWQPLLKLDEAWFLRHMQQQLDLAGEPYRQIEPTGRRPEDDQSRAIPWYFLVSRFNVPNFSWAAARRDEALAELGLMQTALALQNYRIKHGEYPASLAELSAAGGAVSSDPFSDKAFVYRRENRGYLLYSLGRDLVDNHGLSRTAAMKRSIGQRDRLQYAQYDLPLALAGEPRRR